MANLLNYFRRCWNYIIHHRWSKDILRANLFYIFLVVVYNLCLFFKLSLDILDRLLRQR